MAADESSLMGESDSGTKGTELRFGVWRRGRWDWAYRFATPTMQQAKERLGLK